MFGILGFTPFHSQGPDDVEERILLEPGNIERYILRKKIYTLENYLPFLANENTSARTLPDLITSSVEVRLISSKYSVVKVAQEIREYLSKKDFTSENTSIDLVEYGGDILTDGNQNTIISPGLDAFSLALTRELKEYSSRLVVYFPGVDGELPSSYLRECCENSKDTLTIDKVLWKKKLTHIFSVIGHRRPGNTIPNILKVLEGDNKLQLGKKWMVDGVVRTSVRPFEVDLSLQDKGYVFELSQVNNPYSSVFSQPEYCLWDGLCHILEIYNRQVEGENTGRSSDFFMQHIVEDSKGLWSNREKYSGQAKILIDIPPNIALQHSYSYHPTSAGFSRAVEGTQCK